MHMAAMLWLRWKSILSENSISSPEGRFTSRLFPPPSSLSSAFVVCWGFVLRLRFRSSAGPWTPTRPPSLILIEGCAQGLQSVFYFMWLSARASSMRPSFLPSILPQLVHPSFRPFVSPSFRSSVRPLSKLVHQSFRRSVLPSFHLSVRPSFLPSVRPSFWPSLTCWSMTFYLRALISGHHSLPPSASKALVL